MPISLDTVRRTFMIYDSNGALNNTFGQRMLKRERLIGCWSSLASPIAAEVLGLAGFDWLLLDSEHAPNDVLTLIPQLMALKDSISAPVVRPPFNEPIIVKRLLDAGFFNFLFPFVESVEQAKNAVASTRYPPSGMRGISVSQRSNRYGTVPDYLKTVNDNICVMVQIENQAGVDAVDGIAAIEGIDGIFVGPQDLAAAVGHLGQPTHPEVQQVMQHIFDAAARNGKAAGILTGVEAEARRYLEMGATFVAVGSDLGLFRSATQGLRDKFRD